MSDPRTVSIAVAPLDGGWQVTYSTPDGAEVSPPRQLRPMGTAPWSFPQPPATEVDQLKDGVHTDLCRAGDEEPLIELLSQLAARRPGSNVLKSLGRYLFAVLLGDAWATIDHPALTLELHWPADDGVLGRFQWEAMHDGTGFLALRGGVTIVRRAAGPATEVPAATSPLEVLFVVGQGLDDDLIRPAAEYLALLQNLQIYDLNRRLRPRLLLNASTETLAAAMGQRRPAVVHFMTHGRYQAGRAVIQLQSNDGDGSVDVYAANLVAVLGGNGNAELPIVVLSACETGSARQAVAAADVLRQNEGAHRGNAALPFAAELIQQGVPVAVGMTGPVVDLACRLFARAFYTALLSGHDAAEATACGRRAAVQHGDYDPLASYDWALPTVFLAANLKAPRLTLEETPLAAERQRLARDLEPSTSFPAFCDRLPILAAGELLLADTTQQRRLRQGPEKQFMALSTSRESSLPGERFGRTRTLRTLAARASLEGHVPCLVSPSYPIADRDPAEDWPTWIDMLAEAMEDTLSHFQETVHLPCRVSHFLLGQGPRPDDLPTEFEHLLTAPPVVKSRDLGKALRYDLLRCLDAVRQALPEAERPACRLFLLIDDLHRMGGAAEDLLNYGFGRAGIRYAEDDIRVAFTWSRHGQPYEATIKHIEGWLNGAPVESLTLGRFSGLEERLAYQNFLLNFRLNGKRRPLALVPEISEATSHKIDRFFDKLSHWIGGVPSKLGGVEMLIDAYLDQEGSILVDARDEDVVQQWALGGGAP